MIHATRKLVFCALNKNKLKSQEVYKKTMLSILSIPQHNTGNYDRPVSI
jgi:hypothetical protein